MHFPQHCIEVPKKPILDHFVWKYKIDFKISLSMRWCTKTIVHIIFVIWALHTLQRMTLKWPINQKETKLSKTKDKFRVKERTIKDT